MTSLLCRVHISWTVFFFDWQVTQETSGYWIHNLTLCPVLLLEVPFDIELISWSDKSSLRWYFFFSKCIVACGFSSSTFVFLLIFRNQYYIIIFLIDPGFWMLIFVQFQCRLLDPELESSGSLFVGSYILQLILNLPSQMSLHIRDLVAALVRRMQSAQIVGLRSSLLLIFARLVMSLNF